jgi:ribosomal protein L20
MESNTLRQISPEIIAKVRRKLKTLPKREQKKLTKKEAIRQLAAEIEVLRKEKGYSYSAVAEELTAAGIEVTGRSVQMALAGNTQTDERQGRKGRA